MKFYNQSDLFWVLVSAARNAALIPDPALLKLYKDSRIRAATKAARSKNIFLYTEGTRVSTNLNDVTTIYTQPAGTRLMVIGYSDNLFYGTRAERDPGAGNQTFSQVFPQMHRVRVVGREGRALSDDFVMAMAGASGQPRFTSVLLPVPFILEPDEQIAIDLGYDTAMSAPTNIPDQAFIIFCVKVKDQLTSLDLEAIAEATAYVGNHDYQRGIFLNCASLGRDDVSFNTAVAGGVASCETRPANGPLLITGIGTSLNTSRILITDTFDGHSFSLNRPIRSSAICVPDNAALTTMPPAVPGGAPIWQQYFEFPAPHLLRAGALLHCDVINGGIDASGTAQVDDQAGTVIIFQGATV